jgi:hypothetical protein
MIGLMRRTKKVVIYPDKIDNIRCLTENYIWQRSLVNPHKKLASSILLPDTQASFLCPDGFGVDNPAYAKWLTIRRQQKQRYTTG